MREDGRVDQRRKLNSEAPIVLSIMDRLVDLRPEASQDPFPSFAESLRELRSAICQDLTDLLNTRRSLDSVPDEFENVSQSLLTFGLPDTSSLSLGAAAGQERLKRAIEQAIQIFEPRLKSVSVTLQPSAKLSQSLRFRVDALLLVKARLEPVSFDTVLHAESSKFTVAGENK
jgi:type VI secretion system protein ImpF